MLTFTWKDPDPLMKHNQGEHSDVMYLVCDCCDIIIADSTTPKNEIKLLELNHKCISNSDAKQTK